MTHRKMETCTGKENTTAKEQIEETENKLKEEPAAPIALATRVTETNNAKHLSPNVNSRRVARECALWVCDAKFNCRHVSGCENI